ncbi:MAG: hypothetical protein QGI08_01795 [Paracoccaceae bacterium]|jgi:hypothetical protein|nr:hypothetical protein [Paracoccaceae bacterium]MDP7184436.1 hypothetical protein [Paracoccaceae bacterium]
MKKAWVLAAAMAIGATQVQAQVTDKTEACEMSGVFVAQAVEMRVAGMDRKETQAAIKDTITENVLMWSLVLGPMVKQIYQLPIEKMTPDYAEKFVEACLEQ